MYMLLRITKKKCNIACHVLPDRASVGQEKFKMFITSLLSVNQLRSNFFPLVENWPTKPAAARRSPAGLGHQWCDS